MTSRFIKRLGLAFLCVSLLWSPIAAQEHLEDFSAKNTSVANDELRKLRNSVSTINSSAIYVPVGGIIMWSGTIATIPSGWHLCDGTEGTPNLTNRFIVCADADDGGVAKTTLTGSATQSGNSNVAAHTHSGPEKTVGGPYCGAGGYLKDGSTGSYGSGTETYPKYYALAYIMKL
jgi:hypothetical protein